MYINVSGITVSFIIVLRAERPMNRVVRLRHRAAKGNAKGNVRVFFLFFLS